MIIRNSCILGMPIIYHNVFQLFENFQNCIILFYLIYQRFPLIHCAEVLGELCSHAIFLCCKYTGVRVTASRILHEICLLIAELTTRQTNLPLIVRLGTNSDLLIEQYYY